MLTIPKRKLQVMSPALLQGMISQELPDDIKLRKISYGKAGSLTIASGVITVNRTYHSIVVEGGTGAGADALTSAKGGVEGDLLILKPATSGANDTVTVTDGTGAGTFILAGGANFAMDHVDDRIVLLCNGVEWVELSRATNS